MFEHDQVRRLLCDDCKRQGANRRARQWSTAHPTRRKQIRNGWAARNPERMTAARRAWYEAHRDRWGGYRRAAKKRNPIANRSHVRVRKVRLLGSIVVPFTPDQLRQRLAYYGNLCWMCSAPADQIDHVKPVAKGGAHMLCNLRPACGPCNARKSDIWPFP